MKTEIKLIIMSLICVSISAKAQMQTLVANPSNILSSVITIATNQYAVVKSADYNYGGLLLVNMQGTSFTEDFSFESLNGLTIAGPATIQLEAHPYAYYATFVTIEIEPRQWEYKVADVPGNKYHAQTEAEILEMFLNDQAEDGWIFVQKDDHGDIIFKRLKK
jgi:hypothetical protein